MGIQKTVIGYTLAGALVAAQVGQAAAAPMPTSVGTMKAMVADGVTQVHWHGGWGGWGLGAGIAGAIIGGAIASSAYGGYYGGPYYGYPGRTTGMLPPITATARTTAIAPTARITAIAMAIIGLTGFITATTTGDIGDFANRL